MNKLPKLPIGIQTFEKIRKEGYLYVDKTKYLIDLIDNGSVYFLSRPRRFGKSLTISTFDALFSGKRELFKGLYAEEFFERPEYKVHPVIHLDMSRVTTNMGLDEFRASLLDRVQDNAERLGVTVSPSTPADAFDRLMTRTAGKYGVPVVVLVDEYDKPVLDHLHEPDKITEMRKVLRNFYIRIKALDSCLRFVFITGITKFLKMGVFSALNNLEDISMKDEYATMLGYTQDDLLVNFSDYIDATAVQMGQSREDLILQIQEYYDGFSFDGKNRLYNPFSTLNFFKTPKFLNYWFETGTSASLVAYVKKHDLAVESFRGLSVDDEFTLVAEIEQALPESFLFQSGYLTIREQHGRNFMLDYPNNEVLSSIARLFLYGKFEVPGIKAAANNLGEALGNGRAEELVKTYNALLASLPYDLYEREEQRYAREQERRKEGLLAPYAESFLSIQAQGGRARSPLGLTGPPETPDIPLSAWDGIGRTGRERCLSFYHTILFTLIWASEVNTTAENHSYWGRSDIEAEKNGHRYVVELKIADGKEAAEKASEEAMKQIHEKGYADKYAEIATARSTAQGSTAQGSATRGSTARGSMTRGSTTRGSATRGSTARGSMTLIGLAVDRAARKVGAYRIEEL